MLREEKLAEFVGWAQQHITGDEKGQAQIFLDRLFQAFGHAGVLDGGREAARLACAPQRVMGIRQPKNWRLSLS